MTQGLPSRPKILYAFQGTGNGHSARASKLVPELRRLAQVDVLCSGLNRQLELDFDIDYQYQGISFEYNSKGGLSYSKTFLKNKLNRFSKDIRGLDLDSYDLILNDFEPVSAWAAKKSKTRIIGIGHQAAFLSEKTPRPPKKNPFAEWVFRNYAPVEEYIGFHFKSYDEGIYGAILRDEIIKARPVQGDYMLCYLPAYSNADIFEVLSKVSNKQWYIYSKESQIPEQKMNCHFKPISGDAFMGDLIGAEGLLCSAGFEAPAEAIYLGKKLMVVPIQGQYEQVCNAEALRQVGVPVIHKLSTRNLSLIQNWVYEEQDLEVEVIEDLGSWLQKQDLFKLKLDINRLAL